jgi:hypothetical protein
LKIVKVTVLVEVDDACTDPVEVALNLLDELTESANKGGTDEHVLGVGFENKGEVVDS